MTLLTILLSLFFVGFVSWQMGKRSMEKEYTTLSHPRTVQKPSSFPAASFSDPLKSQSSVKETSAVPAFTKTITSSKAVDVSPVISTKEVLIPPPPFIAKPSFPVTSNEQSPSKEAPKPEQKTSQTPTQFSAPSNKEYSPLPPPLSPKPSAPPFPPASPSQGGPPPFSKLG